MKHLPFLLSAIFLLLITTGCKKSDFKYQSDYDKSLKVWENFKQNNNNTYQYTVGGGSWTGIGWKTMLIIKDGVVTSREFSYVYPDDWQGTIPSEEELSWNETGDEVGSHDSDSGPASPVWTLDDVYKKAKEDWLQKRKNTQTIFDTENEGMISQCGYIPDGCKDDCFVGITITSINHFEELP